MEYFFLALAAVLLFFARRLAVEAKEMMKDANAKMDEAEALLTHLNTPTPKEPKS